MHTYAHTYTHTHTRLHAHKYTSPYPHARIRSVDASVAREIPGVRAVATGHDARGLLVGKVLRDMPVLCWDRVRFVGDRVAAVAAVPVMLTGARMSRAEGGLFAVAYVGYLGWLLTTRT